MWLCRSCHRKYDMTKEKRQKAIKNLNWKGKDKGKMLNENQVIEIRQLFKGGMAKKAIARKYYIDPANVREIVKYKIWRHI